jgi:hypothetical protein
MAMPVLAHTFLHLQGAAWASGQINQRSTPKAILHLAGRTVFCARSFLPNLHASDMANNAATSVHPLQTPA